MTPKSVMSQPSLATAWASIWSLRRNCAMHHKPVGPALVNLIVGRLPIVAAIAFDARIGMRRQLSLLVLAFCGVLTADDLISIGVTSVGHRRKLLGVIALLGAEMTTATAMSAPRDALPPADAERRQLTVMFCDLVGSTALSAQLDPDDLREVTAAYHRAVTDVVTGFDGFVAKYMGDGVPVYFGYPRADEADAERAVRAGLCVVDAVDRLNVKTVDLRARVGIATGLVVVGDLIGAGSAQEQSVVGETPNLASRLQAMAEPDAVVIAMGTRRLVCKKASDRDPTHVFMSGTRS